MPTTSAPAAASASPVARLVRVAGPHRIAAGYLFGVSVARFSLRQSVGERAGAASDGLVLVASLLVLLVVMIGATRLWAVWPSVVPARDDRPAAGARSFLTALAGAAGGAAIVLIVMIGPWPVLLLIAGMIAVEWVASLGPVASRVPLELPVVITEGGLLVAAGALAASGGGPGALVALTSPIAAAVLASSALASAVGLAMPQPPGRRTIASTLGPLPAAIVGLTAGSGAVAIVLAGLGGLLTPERALLSVPVAVMALVFGWLSLADRSAAWRDRRVRILLAASALSLQAGAIVVLLFS